MSSGQSTHRPIAILGAGLAGLSAANYLHGMGLPVVVFESTAQIAGLASSFRHDGFIYDFGAHFITNRLAKAVGIEDQCTKHCSAPPDGNSAERKGLCRKIVHARLKIGSRPKG